VVSIGSKDFPSLQALFLLFSAAVIVANLVADILYASSIPGCEQRRRCHPAPSTEAGSTAPSSDEVSGHDEGPVGPV